MDRDLKNNLLFTLHYFNLLGKPLTLFECWRNLLQSQSQKLRVNLLDIKKALSQLPQVENFGGFYFLKGHKSLVKRRQDTHSFCQPKWKRARRITHLLSCLPFVRTVAICNTVAFNTADRKSDIDLLIIVRDGRIWLARFFVTFWVSLLGLRRHKDKIADRICLSFYLSDHYLNLESIALKGSGEKSRVWDPYLVHWLSQVSPIYDDGVSQEFFKRNNWIEDFVPHYIQYRGALIRRVKPFILGRLGKRILEEFLASDFGDLLEVFLKRIQLYKISRNTKSVAQENNTKVIISDDILKFHEEDLRGYYRDALDSVQN